MTEAERKRRQRERRHAENGTVGQVTVAQAVAALERDWRARAACAGIDPELFYPARGDMDTLNAARAVCRGCPVRAPCIEVGLAELPARGGGVYGGLSNRQLVRLRRQRRLEEQLADEARRAEEARAARERARVARRRRRGRQRRLRRRTVRPLYDRSAA